LKEGARVVKIRASERKKGERDRNTSEREKDGRERSCEVWRMGEKL